MNTQTGPDPATEAIAAALPFIRSTQRNGWVAITLALAAILGVAALLINLGGDGIKWGFVAVFMAAFVPFWLADSVRKKHERQVMPIVAQAFGLYYTKSPNGFFDYLPAVFIPRGGRRSADDQMSGDVAGRSFRFTEVKTETGGKHSSVLFKGVVVEVATKTQLPEFVIAASKETTGFLFFKGNVPVGDMPMSHSTTGPGGTFYGLWSSASETRDVAGLQAFLDRMVEIGPKVLGNSTLYSVACTGQSIFVALRHNRDMFRIGGLTANDQKVMSDIRAASGELAHPISLVTELIRAEEALLAASAAA